MSTFASRPAVFHSSDVGVSTPASDAGSCSLCAATDEALIERIGHGRQDAVEHVFDRHYRAVFRVALRILRDEGEAQDIAQEVFFQVFRSLHQYDQCKGSPRTWILAIAYHRSLDRRQYLNLRRFYDQAEVDPSGDTMGASLNRAYSPPQVIAEGGLDAAFRALTAPQRETIQLYCFEGLTFREIATRRSETFSNTRHHYYRAIEKIREQLLDKSASWRRKERL